MTQTALFTGADGSWPKTQLFDGIEPVQPFPYTEYEDGDEVYKVADWQRDDLEQYSERDWSANWNEMGCYKTSYILWLIQRKTQQIENPIVLIVTTKAGKGTYYKMIPKLLPGWVVYNVSATGVKLVIGDKELPFPGLPVDGKRTRPTIVLTHYQVFSVRKRQAIDGAGEPMVDRRGRKIMYEPIDQMAHKLVDIDWDLASLDEAHRIKERKTGWTKNIKKIKATCKNVMTGTGFINNPGEIWSLLHFLDSDIFSSYWHFRYTYCDEFTDDNGFKRVIGLKRGKVKEFRELVRAVGPRRTKKEVFPNLPDPIFTPYLVELSPVQSKMYKEIRDYLRTLDQKGDPIDSPNVLTALNRLRQICVATPQVVDDYYDEVQQRRRQVIKLTEPSSKLDALMDIIDGLEWDSERRDQCVVFSNFKDPIELAKARFEKNNISYIHMKESDNDRVRYEKWGTQFPKKEHQIFIATLQLGSESIDLTSATTAVFLDRSWSPLHNEQGVSRVWRPPQAEPTNIINIDARATVDKRVLDTNVVKVGWFKTIFGDEENGENGD